MPSADNVILSLFFGVHILSKDRNGQNLLDRDDGWTFKFFVLNIVLDKMQWIDYSKTRIKQHLP